jgi:Tfp pilus assembly protein PilX
MWRSTCSIARPMTRSLPIVRRLDQRGIALPMAMILLGVLTMLMLAFAVLATSEPTIAMNHSRTSVARTMADSGIERVVWGLQNPTANPGGIPDAPATAASPYDGAAYFALGSQGGFTVQVTAGAASTQRTVTAVGWSPDNVSAAKAHRKVQTVLQLSLTPGVRVLDPPCAICVGGRTQVGGNARVDARSNGCGSASPPTTAVRSGEDTQIAGSGDVYGYGNDTHNESGVDWMDGAPTTGSDGFTYTATELATLKAKAQANGAYYQGARSSIPNPIPGGILFIDTTTGNPFTSTTPDSEAGSLTLSGNGTYSGIIVVMGSITISGTNTLNGLVYSANDLSLTGNITVNGGLVSENRKDTSSTNIDSAATGSVVINYNCENIRTGGGTVPGSSKWAVAPGTYLEIEGS